MGIGSQNAYIVKRKGVQFSRDPLNLVNLHSRKHGGFVNTKVCAHTLLLRLRGSTRGGGDTGE